MLVTSVVGIGLIIKAGGASVKEGSTLVLKLRGPLPEQTLPEQPFAMLGPDYISILQIDQVLHEAAFDDRIERLLIRIDAISAGYGKVQELREIIARFSRDSGKPTTCWLEMGGNKEYLVATACDEIFMAPQGFLLVNGLDINVTFFKGTFDKLGIEAEFTRSGKYKSAVEPLTSTEMSVPYRNMLNSLADSIFTGFVDTIAEARGLSAEKVRAIIDDPPLSAAGAQRAGLIDGLYYRDQLLDHLGEEEVEPISADRLSLDLPEEPAATPSPSSGKSGQAVARGSASSSQPASHVPGKGEVPEALSGLLRSKPTAEQTSEAEDAEATEEPTTEESTAEKAVSEDEVVAEQESPETKDSKEDGPARVGLSEYQRSMSSFGGIGSSPRVAVIYCEGQITSGTSDSDAVSGGTMGSATISKAIRRARLDEKVKAIVLRVDSPGGSGLASDIIWRETQLARKAGKPVIISMGDMAASGGYYIAMGADMIIAQPSTLTGSIGVFAGKYNLAELYKKVGLTSEHIKRGAMADIFSPGKPLGDSGRAKLGEFVDEFYSTFLRKGAQGRGTTPELLHRVAQGRVWTGQQAREIGLVDELGSLRTAITVAKEKAGIEGKAELLVLPELPSFIDSLLGKSSASTSLLGALDRTSLYRQLGMRPALGTGARLLRAAPLVSSNTPLLMAPYQIEVH